MQSFLRGTDFLINYVTVNEWAGVACGEGFRRRRVAYPPHPTSRALPLCAVTTLGHPFCEHVLQHSCCSTLLWQRLFLLTSTQKLPSAQDSSFAFHRAGRGDTKGVGGGDRRRGGEKHPHKNQTNKQQRAESSAMVE